MNLIKNDSFTNIETFADTTKNICETQNKYIKKYKKNNFFDELYNIMKNNEFKKFYNNYLDSWDNCEVMIMYLKLFETIETEYFKKFNQNISHKLMNAYLNKIMNDSKLRQAVIQSFDKYRKTAHMKYLDIDYRNTIQNKKKNLRLELKN